MCYKSNTNFFKSRHQPRQDKPARGMQTGPLASHHLMSAETVTQQKEALNRLLQEANQSFQEKQAASTYRD